MYAPFISCGLILYFLRAKSIISLSSKFALILIENTTGTTGDTTIFFNCQVSQRPSKSGKTLEGNFEAQFPQYTISARPRPSDKWVCATLPQSTEFATLPELTITT